MFSINNDFNLFREKKPFLVGDEANRHLIETKLVDILEDFKLESRDQLFLVEFITEGKLTLLVVEEKENTASPGASGQDPGEGTLLGVKEDQNAVLEAPKKGIMKRLRFRFEKMLKANEKEAKAEAEAEEVEPQQESQEGEQVKPLLSREEVPEEADKNGEPTYWTVTPYDLGGHTSYFNSHKLFTCGSSVFFLAFQR